MMHMCQQCPGTPGFDASCKRHIISMTQCSTTFVTQLICTSSPNQQQQSNVSTDTHYCHFGVVQSIPKTSNPRMHCRAQPPWMMCMTAQSVSDRVKQPAAPFTDQLAGCPPEPPPCAALLPAVTVCTAQATHSAPAMVPAVCTHTSLEAHIQILQKG